MAQYDSSKWFKRIHCRKKLGLNASLLTGAQKIQIMDELGKGDMTVLECADYTGISGNSIRKWLRKRKGGEIVRDGAKKGRPSYLTDEKKKVIKDMMAENNDYAMPVSVFNKKVLACVEEVALERGLPKYCVPKDVSRKFLSRLDNELGLTNKNGEQTTEARAKACADIRHVASMIAAQKLMSEVVNPALIVNRDGTSYTVGKNIKQSRQVKVAVKKLKEMAGTTLKAMQEENPDHGTGLYTIKFELLIAADGTVGPPVYVLQHQGMDAGWCIILILCVARLHMIAL